MEPHRRKKLELVVEAPRLPAVLRWLDEIGVTGYTVLPVLQGGGHTGARSGADVSRALENVLVIALTKADVATAALLDFNRRFEGIAGIAWTVDAEVARGEHF